jgi:lysophospholipase L1-like esterase
MARFYPVILIVSVFLAAPAGNVRGDADFDVFVTFGDSLTHNDLLGIAYGNPQDLYGADPAEAVFDKGALSGDELSNYAAAGSESGNVGNQIDLYEFLRRRGVQDRATLFSFEIGGNDVLNNIDLLAAHAPGESSEADAVIDGLIRNMRNDLLRLYRSHKGVRFVVWTVPDVTIIPNYWDEFAAVEIDRIRAHIERVNRRIRKLERYRFVIVLDVYTFFQRTVAAPPVIDGEELVPPPAYGDYDAIFADEVHPTAVSNAVLADELIDRINNKWSDDVSLYTDEELADLARLFD